MGKKRSLKESRQDKGSILVTGVIVLASLVILALPFLFHTSSEFRLTEKSYKSYAALSLAEAGVERAIWELNYGEISTWNGDNSLRTKSITSFQAAGGRVIGDINISVYDPEGFYPVVESAGTVTLSGSSAIDATIRVELEPEGTPLFNYGVFADQGVTIASNVTVTGDVGTNGTGYQAIYVNNNSTIQGDAACGPGGNPQTAIYLTSGAQITGTREAASEVKEFPSVETPQGLPLRGSFYLNNGTTTISSSGEYTSFVVNSNSTVTISGELKIYVTGQFSFGSNTQLQIAAGGKLEVYCAGTFYLNSNCLINTNLHDSTKLIFYGLETLTGEITFSSNATMYAAVYMPKADLVLASNESLNGAFYGRSIELNANVYVVYNEGLGQLEGTPGSGGTGSYVVKSWQEKSN